jgi:transcriptional regulator with XRE-family HTH domain
MKTLKEWQEKQGLSLRALGKMLGVKGTNTAVNVMRWIKSDRIPSARYMRNITEVTGITPNDIYQAYYDKNKF